MITDIIMGYHTGLGTFEVLALWDRLGCSAVYVAVVEVGEKWG